MNDFEQEFVSYKKSTTQSAYETNEEHKEFNLTDPSGNESCEVSFDLPLSKQKWYIFASVDLFVIQYA